MKDGLYRVETSYFVAGFEVEKGVVTNIAPILRKKFYHWQRKAKLINPK